MEGVFFVLLEESIMSNPIFQSVDTDAKLLDTAIAKLKEIAKRNSITLDHVIAIAQAMQTSRVADKLAIQAKRLDAIASVIKTK
jgi:hypothetical protein